MAEYFSFFDAVQDVDGNYDREYNAQEFTDYFATLITTGVMKGALNQLEVITTGSSMSSTLKSGKAFIEGRYYINDSDLILTHDTEVLGKNRIDRIVVRLDLRTESRFVKSFIKKGVASTSPVPPDLQRDQFIYEISLAQVKIIGGQTYINVNDVVDERGKTDICPWAGSNILPSFDDNALANHIKDYKEHIPYVKATLISNNLHVTLDGVTELYEGLAIAIKPDAQHTGQAIIIVNNLGGRFVKKANGSIVNSGGLKKDSIYTIRYNGTDFILQGEGGSGNATVRDVLGGKTFTNDDGEQTGTMPNRAAQIITPTISTSNTSILSGYHNGAGYVKNMKIETQTVLSSSAQRVANTWARYFTTSMLFGFAPVGCYIYMSGVYCWIGSDTFTGEASMFIRDVSAGSYWNPSVSRNPGGGNSGNPLYHMRPDNDYGSGVRAIGNRLYVDIQLSSGVEQPRLESYSTILVVAWGF